MTSDSKQVKDRVLSISVNWVKRKTGSQLENIVGENSVDFYAASKSVAIEDLSKVTNRSGEHPLWEGYGELNTRGPNRKPNQVRTTAIYGNFYTYLVQQLRPNTIVEFGAAFGVSGMYFLAGLEENGNGELLSFEPNDLWANFANYNFNSISNRHRLTYGTFEENISETLEPGQCIDLAFIDAIHTEKFVLEQLDLLLRHSIAGTIILLDDINFSDEMRACWSNVSNDARFSCTASLGQRVGIIEYTPRV